MSPIYKTSLTRLVGSSKAPVYVSAAAVVVATCAPPMCAPDLNLMGSTCDCGADSTRSISSTSTYWSLSETTIDMSTRDSDEHTSTCGHDEAVAPATPNVIGDNDGWMTCALRDLAGCEDMVLGDLPSSTSSSCCFELAKDWLIGTHETLKSTTSGETMPSVEDSAPEWVAMWQADDGDTSCKNSDSADLYLDGSEDMDVSASYSSDEEDLEAMDEEAARIRVLALANLARRMDADLLRVINKGEAGVHLVDVDDLFGDKPVIRRVDGSGSNCIVLSALFPNNGTVFAVKSPLLPRAPPATWQSELHQLRQVLRFRGELLATLDTAAVARTAAWASNPGAWSNPDAWAANPTAPRGTLAPPALPVRGVVMSGGEPVGLMTIWCPRGTLAGFLAARFGDGKAGLCAGDLLQLLRGAAAALVPAHAAGVAHLDVREDNFLLMDALEQGQAPRMVLADFSCARRGVGSPRRWRCHVGMLPNLGLAARAAPEAAAAAAGSRNGGGGSWCGPPADIFSLGVMFLAVLDPGLGPGLKAAAIGSGARHLSHLCGSSSVPSPAVATRSHPQLSHGYWAPTLQLPTCVEPGLRELVKDMTAGHPCVRPRVGEVVSRLECLLEELVDRGQYSAPTLGA